MTGRRSHGGQALSSVRIAYYAFAKRPDEKIGQMVIMRENGRQVSQEGTGVTYRSTKEAYADMERCKTGSGDLIGADLRFHQAILEATGNHLIGALGGPLVDRLPRKQVMIASDLLRMVAVASLFVGGGTPSRLHLYAVATQHRDHGAVHTGPVFHRHLWSERRRRSRPVKVERRAQRRRTGQPWPAA